MTKRKVARAIYIGVLTIGILIQMLPVNAKAFSGKLSSRNALAPANSSVKPSSVNPAQDPSACKYCFNPCDENARRTRNGGEPVTRYLIIDARLDYEAIQQPCDKKRQNVEFKKGERVIVYIINMNPFLFDYTVTKSETLMPETAQNIFLHQLGPLFDFISSSGTVGSSTSGVRSTKCAIDMSDAKYVLDNIEARLDEWKQAYARFNRSYEEVRATYNQLLDPLADCAKLCAAAGDYQKGYVMLPAREKFAKLAAEVKLAKGKLDSNQTVAAELTGSLKDLRNTKLENDRFDRNIAKATAKVLDLDKKITAKRAVLVPASDEEKEALKQEVQDLETARDAAQTALETAIELKETFKNELAGCDQKAIDDVLQRQERLSIEVSNLLDNINTLCANLFSQENRAKLNNMNDAIDIVFKHPDILLSQQFEIGRYSEPTDVKIEVGRKEKAKENNDRPATSNESLPPPCSGTDESATRPKSEDQEPANNPNPAPGDQQKLVKPPNKPETGSMTKAFALPQPILAMYQMDQSANRKTMTEPAFQPVNFESPFYSPSASPSPLVAKPMEFSLQAEAAASKATEAATKAEDSADQDTADTPKYEKKLWFGIQSFSLSGGIVYSRLERVSFQPVLGIPLNRQGMPTSDALTSVIGFKDFNRWTVGPVLLLNTLIVEDRHGNFGLHASVGITGKRTDDNTDIDYFFGPSINVLGRRLFFTAGAYVGKQQRLGGDAHLGMTIGAMDDIPVRTEIHVKPGFSLTFRILPYRTN